MRIRKSVCQSRRFLHLGAIFVCLAGSLAGFLDVGPGQLLQGDFVIIICKGGIENVDDTQLGNPGGHKSLGFSLHISEEFDEIAPGNCVLRRRGSVTVDNENYGRYTGEIQITRSDLKADRRVNVIGQIPENAWLLMDRIKGGQNFMLVRP